MQSYLLTMLDKIMGDWYIPDIHATDVLEITILSVIFYQVVRWIKNTKAWMLLRGVIVIGVFILVAALMKMNTILWLAKNSIGVLATVAIVVFQPELRRALERLGQRDFWNSVMPFETKKVNGRFQSSTITAIVDACYEMSKVKTGALIVVERDTKLTEYAHTGIALDCLVSSQILINIFEHNTPLHDGAVIIRGDRIVAATCYLPLSDNNKLSKELGTRHRAAVGMSEVSDALVISVSEETGRVSFSLGGHITRAVPKDQLHNKLVEIQGAVSDTKKIKLKKGRGKDERKNLE